MTIATKIIFKVFGNQKVNMTTWNEKGRKEKKKQEGEKNTDIKVPSPLRLAPTSFTTTILNDECCMPPPLVHGRKKDLCQFPFFLLYIFTYSKNWPGFGLTYAKELQPRSRRALVTYICKIVHISRVCEIAANTGFHGYAQKM